MCIAGDFVPSAQNETMMTTDQDPLWWWWERAQCAADQPLHLQHSGRSPGQVHRYRAEQLHGGLQTEQVRDTLLSALHSQLESHQRHLALDHCARLLGQPHTGSPQHPGISDIYSRGPLNLISNRFKLTIL